MAYLAIPAILLCLSHPADANACRILPEPDDFITTLGIHERFGGKFKIDIFEEKGEINYRVSFKKPRAEGRPSQPASLVSRTSGRRRIGLVFVESDERLWIFDGTDSLVLEEYLEMSIITTGLKYRPSIASRIPAAVKKRLPKWFKEKFKIAD